MSMQDPIADMLTRVRNGLAVAKDAVAMSASTVKCAIADLLKKEGFIEDYQVDDGAKKVLTITLKYYQDKPVISQLDRISRPSLRVYKSKDQLPRVKDGLGVAVVSTSKGIMSDREARKHNLGGEVICYVS